ncbi:U-box domain-containing protein 40 [Euphorbia peplus]|nr:U-box domain-containing protein 40 [Euphorbia peplus]
MEFQEALMRLVIHNGKSSQQLPDNQHHHHHPRLKHKWSVVSFIRSTSSKSKKKHSKPDMPKEFVCPISGLVMYDPVIVSSGHTFERACVQACNTLAFTPTLNNGVKPDFSTVFPNLALKTAIRNWCVKCSIDLPRPLNFFSAEQLVRAKLEKQLLLKLEEKPLLKFNHPVAQFTRSSTKFTRSTTNCSSSSVESGESSSVQLTPALQLTTRPSCYSSASSSSEIEILGVNSSSDEEEEIIAKLKSPQVFEIEEALSLLRKNTKNKQGIRTQLCTPRLLSALRSLIASRYSNIQVNSVACLVNLSLEKENKVRIVRSGIVPSIVDVLKGGFPEAQEHACGAIFSLALEDHNKTAIGVLGALPPLLHLLRSEKEWTRHDSAFALYHLSLVQSNRTKLVKLGAVPILLGMVKSGHMRSRVFLVLGNLASCLNGRDAMLDSGGVDCLVGVLRDEELESESTLESCVSVLCELSNGGFRFKGLAKAAGAVEVLLRMEKSYRERTKEKARRILEMMKGRTEEEEEENEINWEELLESEHSTPTRCQTSGESVGSSLKSSEDS